ncbi:hypothetical protein MMC17_005846 [Xylographa soralifera]|nr:hypothetical protein [Xylographa soralifera]
MSLDTQRSQAEDAAHTFISSTSPDANLADPFEVPSSWSSQISSWPLDTLDTSLQAWAPPAVSGFEAVDGMLDTATPNASASTSTLQPLTSRQMYGSLPGHDSLIPSSSLMSSLATRALDLSPRGLNALSEPPNASDVLPYSPCTLIHLLGKHPTLLLTDDFCSPFLHRAMYNERVPDMTTLPRTSMAICCSSGINSADSSRYIKRAMYAEQQSLIEVYPTYKCMEQWDALHAMLLYEILELQEKYKNGPDSWQLKDKVKGLQLPFLLKMTQSFSKSYPELHIPNLDVFFDHASGTTDATQSPWNRWMITETARRTIFLANITNFLSNRNFKSAEQSSYYEPLDDELVMNMPLPCSHALWTARTEKYWTKLAMHEPLPAVSDPLSEFNPLMFESLNPSFSQISIKSLFSKVTKDYLRTSLHKTIGFGDSDELRYFIILCAIEQFG